MTRQQVRGDPVQPRSRVRACGVVGGPLLERDAEHLAEQRVGVVDAHPADEIPEHDRGMAVEQRGETPRFLQRRRDHAGVGFGRHHPTLSRCDESVRGTCN
jgi:hypothetical protein